MSYQTPARRIITRHAPRMRRLGAALLLLALLASCARNVSIESKEAPVVRRGPAFLGVVYTGTVEGMRVVRVLPDSPAERSGIVPGDVVTEADGRSMAGEPTRHFHMLIRMKQAGDILKLSVLRRTKTRTLEVELGERPRGFVPGQGAHP